MITDSTISGNSAGVPAAVLKPQASVMITGSTISGNSAGVSGGGIYGRGDVLVNSTTISGNSARGGGGLSSLRYLTVISSTITGNSADWDGGGIRSKENVTIVNSIVAGNENLRTSPDLKRGSPATLTVQHSLIGDNRGTDLPEAPVGSPDANGNLIGGPVGGVIDPRLGPLTDNGGVTPTHALLPGSPAIDAGDPLAVAGSNGIPFHDQRGEPYSRVVAGADAGVARIDMGAVERQRLTASISSVSSPAVTPVDAVTIQFTMGVSDFDLGDLKLSRNRGENLLPGRATLSSHDQQMFVLSGLADVTSVPGYYELTVSSSDIRSLEAGPMDSSARVSWAMGQETMQLTVDTLVDEADGRIDDGDVSLRDAIAAAAPGASIRFSPGA